MSYRKPDPIRVAELRAEHDEIDEYAKELAADLRYGRLRVALVIAGGVLAFACAFVYAKLAPTRHPRSDCHRVMVMTWGDGGPERHDRIDCTPPQVSR